MANKKITIIWRNIPKTKITIDEFNELIDNLKENNFRNVKINNVSRALRVYKSYEVLQKSNYIELKVSYGFDDNKRFYVPTVMENDELKDESKITGFEAYNYVEDLFKCFKNDENITLFKAFSGNNYREQYRSIKACVPLQISYFYNASKQRQIQKCYKGDVSSAFPYQLTKSLPTLHNCLEFNGIVEPTEEYPFAFYINSGHIKIFNELDTRDMNSMYFPSYKDCYNDEIKDEKTILCKKSKYTLKDEFQDMYKHRNEDINQKMYMNACIGFFHKNSDPRLSHIAAVVIARNNQEMLNRVYSLRNEGNGILYIATDSIVWTNKPSNIAVNKKELGAFVSEGSGSFYGVQVGSYQFLKDTGELITKCTYLKNDENKFKIAFGKLPEPKYEKYKLENNKIIQLI